MQTAESDSLYRRLQRHLDRMPVGFPPTESGVEIRILKRLFTPEEAAIALELSMLPEPAATIWKRLTPRPPLPDLEAALARMGEKGIALALKIQGEMRYAKLMYVIGMYERQLPRLTPEFEREARQYMQEAFGHRALHTGKTTQMRIVPVNKTIPVERSATPYDEIRKHVESSPGPFGVIRCICRHGRDLVGESCHQTKLRENCLMIGPAAVWAAESGTGHATSREEMLDLLDQAERDGLVLESENTKSPMFVCCCCGCCCGVLLSAKTLPAPADVFTSNYYAVVDAEVCQSCGSCESRCQMDAISSPEEKAVVDRSRCIGCGVCLSTCPSGALRLEAVAEPETPPDDIKALYLQMYKDRFGAWGMATLGLRAKLGMKI